MTPLSPGPGKVFVQPDERHKILPSGLALPQSAQDDAFHGTVIAVGPGAWFGTLRGESGLVPEPMPDSEALARFTPVRRIMPVVVGDVVVYEVEAVQALAVGFSADSPVYYALDVRDILGTVEHA